MFALIMSPFWLEVNKGVAKLRQGTPHLDRVNPIDQVFLYQEEVNQGRIFPRLASEFIGFPELFQNA